MKCPQAHYYASHTSVSTHDLGSLTPHIGTQLALASPIAGDIRVERNPKAGIRDRPGELSLHILAASAILARDLYRNHFIYGCDQMICAALCGVLSI